jgi:hypothetical protein
MTEVGDHSAEQPTAPAGIGTRPAAVWAMGILVICFGLLGIVLGIFVLAILADTESDGQNLGGVASALVVVSIVVSVAQVAGGVLVLAGKNWGRLLAITVSCLVIASDVVLIIGGTAQGCLGIIINVALIAGLMRQEVRDWCYQ